MRRWLLRLFVLLIFIIFVLPFLIPLPSIGDDPALFADGDGAFITVNGLSTYYREAGDPAGDPIVLLHGWGASTFSWRATIPVLAEAGYRVIAFDRPPYGLSAKTGDLPMTQAQQAAFTAAFMDALNIDRATLVGHSMGGGVISYFAVEYPERVDQLVFVAGSVSIADDASDMGGGAPEIVATLLSIPPFERWALIGARTFVQPSMFADLQRTAYYDPDLVTAEVAAGYQTALRVRDWDRALLDVISGRGFDGPALTPDQIAAIDAPTLIIWGEDDEWVPIGRGLELRELLPDPQWITYPQTGHLPMEEQPTQFNQDLIAFLAG